MVVMAPNLSVGKRKSSETFIFKGSMSYQFAHPIGPHSASFTAGHMVLGVIPNLRQERRVSPGTHFAMEARRPRHLDGELYRARTSKFLKCHAIWIREILGFCTCKDTPDIRIEQNFPWSHHIWLILQGKHVQSFMIFGVVSDTIYGGRL